MQNVAHNDTKNQEEKTSTEMQPISCSVSCGSFALKLANSKFSCIMEFTVTGRASNKRVHSYIINIGLDRDTEVERERKRRMEGKITSH